MELATCNWTDYALIDSGNGRRLERFGNIILSRPAPQALWPQEKSPSLWKDVHAVYHRSTSGGGQWEIKKTVPESWKIQWDKTVFTLKLTGFGHVGLFPEQVPCWQWIREKLNPSNSPLSILNLFAYTGGSTLASTQKNHTVCHVDGSKGAITWARQNLEQNHGLKLPVRWIADDVMKFMRREVKRGRKYDGVILDPPTFGRGPKGQVWKIERDLPELINILQDTLSESPVFLLFTCHSPHISNPGLSNLLNHLFKSLGGTVQTGDLVIHPENGLYPLPAGIFGRWSAR
jgi:23S rRNA (cytosine1962-C5)-methyltransferase